MSVSIYLAYINGYHPEWEHEVTLRIRHCLPFRFEQLPVKMDLDLFYSPDRRQYHSTLILAQLVKHLPREDAKIIGITNHDLYIPILTFLFGESQLDGSAAVISTYRLHNEFYGIPDDRELLITRTGKEALHELGHTFGLIHCPDYQCVMNSSTYVEDIDIKEGKFCKECQQKIGVSCD